MDEGKIKINRAPVLTLWAAVVAERLGYKADEALTLGQAVAGMTAASKARRLGMVADRKPGEGRPPSESADQWVELMDRRVPVRRMPSGLRAVKGGVVASPDGVQRYLAAKFGANLDAARDAMVALAKSLTPDELERKAFDLYMEFRPEVPRGVRGWGAAGELDLDLVRRLARGSVDDRSR